MLVKFLLGTLDQDVKCAVAAPDRMSCKDLLSDGFPLIPEH